MLYRRNYSIPEMLKLLSVSIEITCNNVSKKNSDILNKIFMEHKIKNTIQILMEREREKEREREREKH